MLTKTQWRINAPSQKMFKFNHRGAFGEAKRKVSLMIEEVRQEWPEDADYLEAMAGPFPVYLRPKAQPD
jgi:hypothetical protein